MEDFDRVAGRDGEMVPVSVDSKHALKEFRAKHGMKTERYSDAARKAAQAHGVLLERIVEPS